MYLTWSGRAISNVRMAITEGRLRSIVPEQRDM